jgi:hypothetical protein
MGKIHAKLPKQALDIFIAPPTSVATAWLESRKPDKPSGIEAEPSCRNSFGFAVAWLWPKMALSGFKRLKPWLCSRFG